LDGAVFAQNEEIAKSDLSCLDRAMNAPAGKFVIDQRGRGSERHRFGIGRGCYVDDIARSRQAGRTGAALQRARAHGA
jgi:hypothetical protein